MVKFERDFSLKNSNTFGFDVKAQYYFEFTEKKDLPAFLSSFTEWRDLPILFLGDGSNLLFANDINGIIFHPAISGISLIAKNDKHLWVEVGAGENWDSFVEFTVNSGYGGLENLSLIPGKVGASAVQNIGAYGVEVAEYIDCIKGFDLQTFNFSEMTVAQCKYAYRDSIFKNELRNRFIVTSVVFKLDKYPAFKLDYGDLRKVLKGEPDLRSIREAVINIRNMKLPDPKVLGNAGSYFKNPVVSEEKVRQLQKIYSKMPVYSLENGLFKLAAGWLIEQCGWKGYRSGNVGVHNIQALVLVNYGNACGTQIVELAAKITKSVTDRFGVDLEPEVQMVGC